MESGKFFTARNVYKESIYLMKYLKSLGKTKDEIYDIWAPIFCDRKKIPPDDFVVKNVFDELYGKTRMYRIEKPKTFCIYQLEIDEINSVFAPLWTKRFLLLLYCCCKVKNRSYIDDRSFLWHKEICDLCDKGRLNDNAKHLLIENFIDIGLLRRNVTRIVDSYGEETFDETYEFVFQKHNGPVAFCWIDPYEIPKYFHLIKNEMKCVECGKTFTRSSRSKTVLCPECWERKRKTSESERKYEYFVNNLKVGEKKAVCRNCRAEFIKSGRSQTELCHECWKEDLKARDRMRKKFQSNSRAGKVQIPR